MSPTERSDASSRLRIALLFGSAMMANDDSTTGIYPSEYIPVKSCSSRSIASRPCFRGKPLGLRFLRSFLVRRLRCDGLRFLYGLRRDGLRLLRGFGCDGLHRTRFLLLRRFRAVERDRLADERLEGGLVDFSAFENVDRAAYVAVETRVEETGRILQSRALGERELHLILVGFARADDAVVRKNRSAHPLPLLDDVRVCFLDELAHSAEGFPAPVPEFGDSFRDELRCRLALARVRLFHVLILEVPDIFHLQDSGG